MARRKKKKTKKHKNKTLRKLLSLGKEKGYLTYEQINGILPEDVVSSEEIDELFTILGEEDIQIVDSESAKGIEKEAAREKEEDKKEEPVEAEFEDAKAEDKKEEPKAEEPK